MKKIANFITSFKVRHFKGWENVKEVTQFIFNSPMAFQKLNNFKK